MGLVNSILFQPPTCRRLPEKVAVSWVKTSRGDNIPTIFIEHEKIQKKRKGSKNQNRSTIKKSGSFSSSNSNGKLTLLYSHANSEDLGMLYNKLEYMAQELNVNILAYDYTGYGYSKVNFPDSEPSEEACYADIEAVYSYLNNYLKVPHQKIVLFGRSVGTGPSCYLAEKLSSHGIHLGGVILHSPFLSIYRVVADCGFSLTMCGDAFPNVDFVEGIDNCPVYIIHGTDDEIVPFYHGCALYDALAVGNCASNNALARNIKCDSLWVDGMGHNGMSRNMSIQIMQNLSRFLEQVDRRAIELSKTPRNIPAKDQEVRTNSIRDSIEESEGNTI